MIENSIENDKDSNKKSEKITKIEKISTENQEKSDEKSDKISEKSDKSENISKESEKIPYYKIYYQRHKDEIKAKRLEKLKGKFKEIKEPEKLNVVKVDSLEKKDDKLKPIDKVKVGFWNLSQEAILGIFIISLIVGIVVYRWFIKRKENEESR